MLRRLARALRDDATFVDTLIAESGKPRYEAEGIELFYTLELTRYYTGRAGRRALADELRAPLVFANKRARVVRHPRGVVAVIGPWNWPLLNNYADCVAPLAAGNAVVLKPSEHTPLTSLRVAELARTAGVPDGVFQVVPGRGDAGAALTAAADMIFFTGSASTGKEVAKTAAERLVPVVLELGGKSPMIVLADADLPRAARAAVWSGFSHSGQVCIRTERVLVEASVADQFINLAASEIARLRQAPPQLARPDAADVDVGAITFAPQIERAERHIADAVARGGRVVTGGTRRADLPGRFFAPTLIAEATPDMDVMREETFGPVLPVMRVADAEEALRIANASPMGLSGSIWSRDARRASALARRLDAGSVCVNDVLVNYFVRRGAAGRHQGERHGLPPRPGGAAPVLPHRDHRRGPTAAGLAVAPARPPADDVPLPLAHATPAALGDEASFTRTHLINPAPRPRPRPRTRTRHRLRLNRVADEDGDEDEDEDGFIRRGSRGLVAEAFDDLQQFLEVDGLAQSAVGLQRLRLLFHRAVRAQQHDRQVAQLRVDLLDHPKFRAAHAWHHEVEQDQPGAAAVAQVLQRLLAIDSAFDGVTFVAQRLGERFAHVEVVFHDQNREVPHSFEFTRSSGD